MDLDSRDKQRIHTDHSHLCINLLRRLNKSDLPRPNTNIENAANSFYSDTIPLLNLLYWQKWNVKLALMVVLFVRHTRSNMVAGYDAIEILHWNSTLKFHNCHVKRSEIWLVLPTPEQWKSTVWTRISCQAIFPTNGLGKANCERILFICDTIKYTRLWQSYISERVKDANDSPQRSHGKYHFLIMHTICMWFGDETRQNAAARWSLLQIAAFCCILSAECLIY